MTKMIFFKYKLDKLNNFLQSRSWIDGNERSLNRSWIDEVHICQEEAGQINLNKRCFNRGWIDQVVRCKKEAGL